VYSRADLSRTVTLVVALFLTATATSAVAHEFRAADTSVQPSELMSDMIRSLGREPVELPDGQILTGLATRVTDGAGNDRPSFVTTDHYRLAGYYILTEME
jgi:TRAP-type C4-dicarboxylate transport system substrate-binding protein